MPSSGSHAAAAPPARVLERAHRAALAGLAFAVLDVVGLWMLSRAPELTATDGEITAFYADSGERWVLLAAGIYVLPMAGIAFVWFLAALRQRTLRAAGMEDPLLSTVQLVSGTLYVAVTFVAGAAAVSTAAAVEFVGVESFEPEGARQQLALATALIMIFSTRMGAVFMASGTFRARRAGLLPAWFHRVSIAAVLVLLLWATYHEPVTLLIPLWVAAASLFVLRRLPNAATPLSA